MPGVKSLSVTNPNLSVIMPSGCNAKCSFCYWEEGRGLTADKFGFVSTTLPPIFEQCNSSGR